MKKMLICLLFILMPLVAFADEEQGFTYKEGVTWGIKQSVLASLEKPPMHMNDYSYFINNGQSEEGLETTLAYFFTLSDKLAQIAEIYDNYNYKIIPIYNYNNFSRVRSQLVAQFGDPAIERTIWPSQAAQQQFKNDDMAGLVAGKAELVASWNLPDTDIMLSMALNQNRVRIIVVYQSKTFADTYFKEDNERQKSGTAKSY